MPATDNPWWWDRDAFLEALENHGSVAAISRAAGGNPAPPTLRYWAAKHGIKTRRGSGRTYGAADATPPPEHTATTRLGALEVEEVTRLLEAVGHDRLADLLGSSRHELSAVLRDLGVVAPDRLPRSPRMAALERRVRELEATASGVGELADAIRDAAAGVALTVNIPSGRRARRGSPLFDTAVDVVFHVSDIQYGEVVHPEEVPGGRYSPEVFAEERLPTWVQHATDLVAEVGASHPIGTVWFAQGGDFVEGDGVFAGQEWHLAMDAGTQVATLSPLWAGALAQVAGAAKHAGAERCHVVSVVGNHGVHGGRRAGAVPPSMNYDHLVYQMVRHILAGQPSGGGIDLYLEDPLRACYFDAQGHGFLLTHGDQDRGGGLIGVAAVTGMRNDLMVRRQTGMDHRYHLKGHYHRPTTITPAGYDRVLWNGAWIGANNLSIGRGGASYPEQHAYVVHPTWGASPRPLPLLPVAANEADVTVVR